MSSEAWPVEHIIPALGGVLEEVRKERDEAREVARKCFAHWSYADKVQMADDLPDWVKQAGPKNAQNGTPGDHSAAVASAERHEAPERETG